MNSLLEETIPTLREYLLEQKSEVKGNLTNRERKALESLKSDKPIVIKEADKGGAVVCMDSDYYRNKSNGMLSE